MIEAGLRFEVVDPDDDYLGIEVTASNPRFAGSTFLYSSEGELQALAERLRGFPVSKEDERTVVLGHRESHIAGGFLELRFRCVDAVGHCKLHMAIEDERHRRGGPDPGRASFTLAVEAAAVDRFVEEFIDLAASRQGRALLATPVPGAP